MEHEARVTLCVCFGPYDGAPCQDCQKVAGTQVVVHTPINVSMHTQTVKPNTYTKTHLNNRAHTHAQKLTLLMMFSKESRKEDQ